MDVTLPVNLEVAGRRCVVVDVPPAKFEALGSRNAEVVAIDGASFAAGDLDGAFLVICDAHDEAIREAVWQAALERSVLCNCVDDPHRCSFIFPAIVRRGHLQIAISTDGASPAVAVRIKQAITDGYGEEYAELLEMLAEARPAMLGRGTFEFRRAFWNDLLDRGLLDLIRQGRADEAREIVRQAVAAS